jgi:hypothetical protein
MDKNELKQRIEQVAVIKDLSPKKDPTIRLNDGVDECVRAGDDWVEINSKYNPTLGFEFIKLKEQHRLCELNCGDIVSNQVIEKRLCTSPETHWRTRCANCKRYVSPEDGTMVTQHEIQSITWRYYYRKNK